MHWRIKLRRIKIVALFTVLLMVVNVPGVFAQPVTDNEKLKLEFEDIGKLVEEYNPNVRISRLTAEQYEQSRLAVIDAKEDLSEVGKTYLESAKTTMVSAINDVNSSIVAMEAQLAALGNPAPPASLDEETLNYLNQNFVTTRKFLESTLKNLRSTRESLTGQLNQIKAQLEQLDDGLDDAEKSLQRNAEDLQEAVNSAKLGTEMAIKQLTWGAENAYIAYNKLNYEIAKLDEAIKMLELNLMAVKIRKDVGLASELQVIVTESNLKNLKNTRQQLIDSQKDLLNQINLLIGRKYDAEIEISGVPELEKSAVSQIAVNYDKDLETAMENCYSVKLQEIQCRLKEYGLSRAEEDDGADSNNYYQAQKALYIEKNKLAEEKRQFENAFFQKYKDILSLERDIEIEKTLLESKRAEYENTKAKYEMGQVSYLTYAQADSDYKTQELAVEEKELELFKLVREYKWMKEGISTQSQGQSQSQSQGQGQR